MVSILSIANTAVFDAFICLRCSRTSITCKADAFAAPYALLDRNFMRDGSNRLTLREKALADFYALDLGRPDLADYARRGKKIQRLYEFFRFERIRPKSINAMRRAFLDGPEEAQLGEPETKSAWYEMAMERYGHDPLLTESMMKGDSMSSLEEP